MYYFPCLTKPLVGLDLQPHAVYLAQVCKKRRHYHVKKQCTSPIPVGVFKEGKWQEWDTLQAIIQELVQTHALVGMPAALALPAQWVRLQSITVPAGLKPLEIEAEIYAQLQRELPGVTEALAWDYVERQQIGSSIEVVYAATRLAYLQRLVNVIQAAGLTVKIVDIDLYAIQRMLAAFLRFSPQTHVANVIIYFTQTNATLLLCQAQLVRFHQQWEIANREDFQQTVKQKLQYTKEAFSHLTIEKILLCGDGSDATTLPDSTPIATDDFWIARGIAMREVPAW